jgi:hypothetical protein
LIVCCQASPEVVVVEQLVPDVDQCLVEPDLLFGTPVSPSSTSNGQR